MKMSEHQTSVPGRKRYANNNGDGEKVTVGAEFVNTRTAAGAFIHDKVKPGEVKLLKLFQEILQCRDAPESCLLLMRLAANSAK